MKNKNIKLKFLIAVITLSVSCGSEKGLFEQVQYKQKKKTMVSMSVPRGFDLSITSGSHGSTYYYNYPDSSLIYIDGETSSGPNYDNIRASGQFGLLFEKEMSGDTSTIFGVDKNGLYWKNMIIKNGFSIGYMNIPENKKLTIDSCLNTISLAKR